MLRHRLTLLLILALTWPTSAQKLTPEQEADKLPTREVVAHGLAMKFVMPDDWHVLSNDTSFRVADSPTGSLVNMDDITFRASRIPVDKGTTASEMMDTFARSTAQKGADVQAFSFTDQIDGYAIRIRSEAFIVGNDGERKQIVYRMMLFGAISKKELLVVEATFPESDDKDKMLMAWIHTQKIAKSVQLMDQKRSAPPVPEDAETIKELPYSNVFDMNPGECITLVLPGSKSLSFWALSRQGTGGPGSKSGLSLSWGERPFCQTQIEEKQVDGVIVATPKASYIEQGGVITHGSKRKTRELTIDGLAIELIEDMTAEDKLPVRVTIKKIPKEGEAD